MPSEDVLPATLKDLARRHAIAITEQDFDEGVSKLAKAIDITLGEAEHRPSMEAHGVFGGSSDRGHHNDRVGLDADRAAITGFKSRRREPETDACSGAVGAELAAPVQYGSISSTVNDYGAGYTPTLRPADFVNAGVAGSASRAVLIVDEQHRPDIPTTERIAAGIGAENSLFKDAFVREGLFVRAQRGDVDVLRPLGLDRLEMIALGVKSTNTASEDVAGTQLVRATVSIVLRVIRPTSGFAATTISVQGTGAGFDAVRATESGAEKALAGSISQLKSS